MKIIQYIFFILFACCLFGALHGQELSYTEKVKGFFKKNQWDKGKKVLDEGLEDSPLDADLFMLKGKYYHYKHNNNEARYNLIKSIELDPNNVEAKKILVNVEMEEEHYSSAICYINELLQVNPYLSSLWRKKIQAYRLQGNDIEADRLLKRIRQIYPEDDLFKKDHAYSLEQKIIQLKSTGKIDEALVLTNELMSIGKGDANTSLTASKMSQSLGDYNTALGHLNRALLKEPGNINLIKEKAVLLSEIGNEEMALEFLRKNKSRSPEIAKIYNYQLRNFARLQIQKDPYVLYGKMFESNNGNREALNYLLRTSLSKGYDTDALYYISEAKKVYGENKNLLAKEYSLYKKLNEDAKANQVLRKLYQKYPEDYDVSHDYLRLQFAQGKEHMANGNYAKAIAPLSYVAEKPGELNENAFHSLVNAYLKLGRNQEAIETANLLLEKYPSSEDSYLKKISVFVRSNQEEQALELYKVLIGRAPANEKITHRIGYEEIGLQYLKKVKEVGASDKVYEIADKLIEVNPKNELVYQYVLNNAFEINDFNRFYEYAQKGVEDNPESLLLNAKLVEAHLQREEFELAKSKVDSMIAENRYSKPIVSAKSQVAVTYAKHLLKNKQPDSVIAIADDGLLYDRKNTELKYFKGIAYEQLKEYDSAYYYQSFYTPSATESDAFQKHLEWLRYKSYKNQVAVAQLISVLDYSPIVRSITTLQYSRFHNAKNTFTGRIHYTGRELGAGILGQFEWYRGLSKRTYFRLDAGYGTRYFARVIANFSLYWEFAETYEAEFGVGYRYLPDNTSLLNGVLGVSKSWDAAWLNGKVNVYGDIGNSNVFYNVLLQSKFFVFKEKRSFLHVMTSLGSIPEIGTLDLATYNDWNAFNTMVGAGGQYMLNNRFTVGVLGNWYNIKSNQNQYRNLFNLYLKAFFSL